MKVLFFSPNRKADGITEYSNQVINHLQSLPTINLKTAHEYTSKKHNFGQYDLVHVQHHYSFFGLPLPFLNSFPQFLASFDAPIIVTVHDLILKCPDGYPFLIRDMLTFLIKILNHQTFLHTKITHIIVHAQKQKEQLVALGVTPTKISVLPMGVPEFVDRVSASKSSLKKKWKVANKTVLTILGFIFRRKGYDIALQALKQVNDDNVVLLIAGDTNPKTTVDKHYRQELENNIIKSNLSKRVTITGYLSNDDFNEVLHLTDIVLSPILGNFGSPYSLATAIGYHKAIVASDVDPIVEVNSRMQCMELFETGNSTQLAKKLKKLIKDTQQIQKLEQLTQKYQKKYNFANLAKSHLEIYQALSHNDKLSSNKK